LELKRNNKLYWNGSHEAGLRQTIHTQHTLEIKIKTTSVIENCIVRRTYGINELSKRLVLARTVLLIYRKRLISSEDDAEYETR